VGGGGQVAQRDVGRWFGRADGDDLVRPAQATVDVAAQLRHVPAWAGRDRRRDVGAVEVTGQQRCLRGDLGAVPIETQGRHAAGTSPSQIWKVSNLLTKPAVKVNTSE
jgi:hypothetical protein